MKINIVPIETKEILSMKEQKILHVSVLNIISLVNGLIVGKEIVMNPIEKNDDIGFEVFLSDEVSEEEKKAFCERVVRQVSMFLKMSEVSYLVNISE
ncbi:hypothetical protein ACFP65_03575 [Marinilactibacillus sp. GCM10026970]|uniref:hypothetical protein n=1 Tax=Marinilactibacillus sp. GCM10026970 TaxID=3252642 RepID=UPI003609399C